MKDSKIILQNLNNSKDLSEKNVIERMVNILNANDNNLYLKYLLKDYQIMLKGLREELKDSGNSLDLMRSGNTLNIRMENTQIFLTILDAELDARETFRSPGAYPRLLLELLSDINCQFCLEVVHYDISLNSVVTFEHCTLLHIAAAFNCEKIAKLLIDKGANVDSLDSCMHTPLHYAAVTDSKEVAEVLLTEKANVNARDRENKTPLQYAFKKDHLKTAKLLIDNYADQSFIFRIHESRAIKAGIVGSVLGGPVLNAIFLSSFCPPHTDITFVAFSALFIASMIIAGSSSYGLTYMCSKYALSSKLAEVSYDAAYFHSPQPAAG